VLQVLEGLNRYKMLYGDLEPAEDFVVPFEYEWPR